MFKLEFLSEIRHFCACWKQKIVFEKKTQFLFLSVIWTYLNVWQFIPILDAIFNDLYLQWH